MSSARTAILTRVRAAQRTAVLGSDPVSAGGLSEGHAVAVFPDGHLRQEQDLTLRFEQELTALGVIVQHAEAPEAVREAVRTHTAGLRVLAWDTEALPFGSFDVLSNRICGSSSRDEQAAAEIGITGCDAAVAETGSLVLLSGPGRSRAVSLLPPVHLAIVRRGNIVATLAEAFSRLDALLPSAACCSVITGPSRTADIELTLTLGIHGPGRLIVVIGP
jgi:L-lactate dehydrogenase complex protein LldG